MCLNLCESEILKYADHEIIKLEPEYIKIPKYAKGDAPNWAPGNGHTFIDLSELSVKTLCHGSDKMMNNSLSVCGPTTFSLLMFKETTDKSWMDYWPENSFCCSKSSVNSGLCHFEQLNTLIVPVNLPGAFLQTFTIQNGETTKFSHDPTITHHDIKETGMYILLMGNCGASSSNVLMSGQIESMDPYGYLPADLFGNLPFYLALSCTYTILAILWIYVNAKYIDQVIPLQFWISVLIMCGMVETTGMYGHYEYWNEHGSPSLSIMTFGLIFGISKRTLSRIVVMLVSLGYGIVKPSIGADMGKVMQLGGAYFVVSFAYVIVTMFPTKHKKTDENDVDYVSLFIFLLAAIDTVFYVWIIQSISALLATLAVRQQGVKYLLYRNFRGVLFLALFCAIIWSIYSGLVIYSPDDGEDHLTWQSRWTVDALWEFIYFVVLAAIAHMWAPSENSQRYAYSAELQQLDEDDDYKVAGNFGKGEVEMAERIDAEYGGSGTLNDTDDPFRPKGALDTSSAINKQQ